MGKARVDLRSVTTVGLDLAKHVFQIHAVDADGKIVIATALRRRDVLSFFDALPPSVIGLEACGSAHHWARELVKLGHDARLMHPSYVKAYVRRQKNDAADAAAICEAVTRPSMRFVSIRSIDNQAVLMHHKVREILVSQRTQLLNALRGHLAEVGVIAAQGANGAYALAAAILEGDSSIPLCVRDALAPIVRQLQTLNDEIAASDRAIMGLAKTNETAKRLMSVPGIGPITASAIAASVQDVGAFSGPREFAAFLGLTPRQNSSGGKERLGRVSKMGNRYLRKLLVVGAHAVLFHRRSHQDGLRTWAAKLMETKPFKLVAVAIANKLARIAFALMRDGSIYGNAVA
ncbi:MAG: IS110 family transposase [Methylocella sp.]|jgi:transposase